MQHKPRKRFGQNFLQSSTVISQIISAINVQSSDKIVEIGPGLGALTSALLTKVVELSAVEIDRDLQAYLEKLYPAERLKLIKQNALELDYSSLGTNLRIVGNLPYNIAVPLIMNCLSSRASIKDMHFMLQKEVAKRLTAVPGTRDYGRITVVAQYFSEVSYLFDVPPEVFFPQPKVDSAIVRLRVYPVSPFVSVGLESLSQTLALAFAMKRKTLINNLKDVISVFELESLDIDPKARAEQISVNQFAILANYLSNKAK